MNELDRTIQNEGEGMRDHGSKIKATGEVYPELQAAYDRFNRIMFADMLPPCLITLNRSKRTLGYFSQRRFVRYDGQVTHEIAMNPAYFASRSLKDTLSTLAHEQVHLWQEALGTPSRSGYHNKEWAAMAEAVGLMPTHTGQPGGRKVGEQMDHYIIPGGLFDRAADELIVEGFRISWLDRFPEAIPLGAYIPPPAPTPSPAPPIPENEGAGAASAIDEPGIVIEQPRFPEGIDLGAAAVSIVWPSDRRPKASKIKYRCPGCSAQVWGKGGMDLQCNRCDMTLRECD